MEINEDVSDFSPYIDTVRSLHQTVISLRAALEESKKEIFKLKSNTSINLNEDPTEKNTISLVDKKNQEIKEEEKTNTKITRATQENELKKSPKNLKKHKIIKIVSSVKTHKKNVSKFKVEASFFAKNRNSQSLDNLAVLKTQPKKKSKSTNFLNIKNIIYCDKNSEMNEKNDKVKINIESGDNPTNEDQEVDDIELIFTTDETKDSEFKEQLVSIDSIDLHDESHLIPCPDQSSHSREHSIEVSDRELDDDVFDNPQIEEPKEIPEIQRENSELHESKSDNSINQEGKSLKSYYSYQDSSFENKSLEKDESFDRFEERIRIIETDISKCGIQEIDYIGVRRNTCPNPLQYRPLIHREAISKGFNTKKSRPILVHSNASRKNSGAQTDITALPGSQWRSESSLASKSKLGENFTTLPSKYPMPVSKLRLSEKTVEARRVLLSDIGFTSMVPELSRSADHLGPATLNPPVTTYGQFLRTSDLYSPAYTSQKFTWTMATATPSEGSHSHSRYSSIYPLSPPVQTRRCSAPVSPSRKVLLKPTPSRVRFANGSLPELRGDWGAMGESGDSTDSLVDEAENYLRRSIDCIVTDTYSEFKKSLRRSSAPETTNDNTPPYGWQPFLPRNPRDLKIENWVKVITSDGRVRGGRVRYVGPVHLQTDQFVGVQLTSPDGLSDGTYNTRRYFQCEPYHAIFVPFKKVIMGWRP